MKSAPTKATSRSSAVTSNVNARDGAASKTPEETLSDDDDLVRRFRNGDQNAFRSLYDRYHRRAYFVALGVVKQPQDAQDVVQEAFIKVHRSIEGFQGNSTFYTWLYRIVKNLSIDYLRRRKSLVALDDRLRKDDGTRDKALIPRTADHHPGKTARRRELSDRIMRALHTLPDHHREVLVLREFDGLSYEEIAQVVEVPKGTVMSRLFHARKKMQSALADYLDGDFEITE